MPGYNFKARFAQDVETGRKRQTIRQCRKRPTRVGDTLYLFTGQRTSRCRRLGEWPCVAVLPFLMLNPTHWVLDGQRLRSGERDELAQADGFETQKGLWWFLYLHYGLPFDGEAIRW